MGSHGRAFIDHVPELNLLAGDKLERGPGLSDAGDLESLDTFPCPLVFWRLREQTLCLLRCTLWDPMLHITPNAVLRIDLMHTLHLGVMIEFGKEAVWSLLGDGVWHTDLELTEAEALKVKLALLRHDLWAWWKHRTCRII